MVEYEHRSTELVAMASYLHLFFESTDVAQAGDTGTTNAIIPKMVAERNKVKWTPVDADKPDYEVVTGMKLTLIGQAEFL